MFQSPGPGTSSAMKTAVRTILLVALVAAAPVIASAPAGLGGAGLGAGGHRRHPSRCATFTAGAQCTANFVFYSGTTVYLGQAAHCSGTGAATETDGCTSSPRRSAPPSTWRRGDGHDGLQLLDHHAGERRDECRHLRVQRSRADPPVAGRRGPGQSVDPVLGWPDRASRHGTTAGRQRYSYGNSSLRLGVSALSPKRGVSLGDAGNGWSHTVYTGRPGFPATRAARSSTPTARRSASCRRRDRAAGGEQRRRRHRATSSRT